MIQTEQSATLGVSQDQTLFIRSNDMVSRKDLIDNLQSLAPMNGAIKMEEIANVVNRMDGEPKQATAYGLGRDSFNSGTNAQFTMSIEEETQPPITERGAGGVCSITQ